MGVAPLAIADTFVGAIIKLELDHSRDMVAPLDDALAVGATACVLAATAMAHGLYLRFGFRDVMPMVGFQTGNC